MNILNLKCQIETYWKCPVTGQAVLCGGKGTQKFISNQQSTDRFKMVGMNA